MFPNKFDENSSKLARKDWRKMFLYIATNVHQPETLPRLLNTTNVDEIFMNKSRGGGGGGGGLLLKYAAMRDQGNSIHNLNAWGTNVSGQP